MNCSKHKTWPTAIMLVSLWVVAGCQTPTMALGRATTAKAYKAEVPTVVEPLFDETELEQFSQSSTAGRVTTTTVWKDKIWLVRPEQRRIIFGAMLPELAQAKIADTNAVRPGGIAGKVRVVRLTLASYQKLDEDLLAYYGCLAGAFFPICPPLIFAPLIPVFVPMKASEKIDVIAKVYEVDTQGLRLVESPGAEFPIIDVSNGQLLGQQRYEIPWMTEHGLFSPFKDDEMTEILKAQFAPAIADITRDIVQKSATAPASGAPSGLET